jgi:phage tail tape-measure protein
VGAAVGAVVGLWEGAAVGAVVGFFVGAAVGAFVGAAVRAAVGCFVGVLHTPQLTLCCLARPSQDSRRAAWRNPQQPQCNSGQCGNGERYLVVSVVDDGKRLP